MQTSVKVGGFAVLLAALFAASVGIGNAVDPVAQPAPSEHAAGASEEHLMDPSDATSSGTEEHDQHADAAPGGLMVSEHGYTLELTSPELAAGVTPVTFRITGPDGRPVTGYERTHDKDLHFIAVRRDTNGFQHLHPTLDETGTWTADVELTPGTWRFFADFRPAGHGMTMTLGADAFVAGAHRPQPVPEPSRIAEVDRYTVVLDGSLVPGVAGELTLTVHRDGRPVTDLQPYLAAYGHLVALRVGDLGYLHVHPDGEPDDGVTQPGPEITFGATAPSAGTYRLFLDFQHDGVVRTAEFTVLAQGSADHTDDHNDSDDHHNSDDHGH